jgi:Family of unknown function (DUF6496)
MPSKTTLKRARADKRAGQSPTTQAGEFVREEIHHIREGKHGARSAKQAIAIGLSKARRAGVDLKPPRKGQASARTRKSAAAAYRAGQSGRRRKTSTRRSRASLRKLKREGRRAASRRALSRQAKSAAKRRRRRAQP